MKKVLFMLAFAGLTMAANAQFILGGQLGINTNGGSRTNEVANPTYTVPNLKTMDLTIAPTISYVLNENMQVGVSFSMTRSTTINYTAAAYAIDKEAWAKDIQSTYGLVPYFRYYFAQAGNFNFFCQADLELFMSPRDKSHTYTNITGTAVETDVNGGTSSTSLGLSIIPGVNYKFNDNWSADCFIDLAGLTLTRTVTKSYGVPGDNDKLTSTNVDNDFGFTANASAQTLNAHLGNFRIGINYHF